jgi:glucosamine--fructose-6-phosphate aminotransferase (isomerizing)
MPDEPYQMLSYVLENGAALARTLERVEAPLQQVADDARSRGCKRIVLSGVGSSYTAAWSAKLAFDCLVDLPTQVLPTTELSYYPQLVDEAALVAILSRSGERKRVIAGMGVAQERGALTVAITGAADSLMAELATRCVLTAEGPEVSFPKTKSVTCGIGAFLALALALAPREGRAARLREQLLDVPHQIDAELAAATPAVERLAREIRACERLTVAGTAGNAGAAMEIALMFQESVLITTQWADTGNLFHGPLCALNAHWLVALMVMDDDVDVSAETVSLVRALGGRSLAVVPSSVGETIGADDVLGVSEPADIILAPLLYLPVLQLLGYHWTVARGLNPDAPPGSGVILEALVPSGRQEPEARLPTTTTSDDGSPLAQFRRRGGRS